MKILPIKEQYRIKDIILQERLDTIVPKYMKEFEIDCYLVMSKEYNEDFVFDVLTPAAYLTARRITILVFMNVEGTIKRFSLSMRDPSLEKYYEPRFHLNEETQMEALNKLLDEFKPKNICIDISKDHKYGDGLSHGLYELLLDELKENKIRLESKSVNYDVMCNNLKEEVVQELKNIIYIIDKQKFHNLLNKHQTKNLEPLH